MTKQKIKKEKFDKLIMEAISDGKLLEEINKENLEFNNRYNHLREVIDKALKQQREEIKEMIRQADKDFVMKKRSAKFSHKIESPSNSDFMVLGGVNGYNSTVNKFRKMKETAKESILKAIDNLD